MKRVVGCMAVAVAGLLLGGCAGDEDRALRQVNRQQAATVESLRAEIVKLNRELEGAVGSWDDLRAAVPVLERELADEISRGAVHISLGREGLVVTVRDSALFDPEEVRLLPAAEESLDKVAAVLAGELSGLKVSVEGYTDNQPVSGPEGVTNWEYSVDCATAVLHYLVDSKGLSPERFGVSGFGEHRPVASNETEEGRDQNRRVSIVIFPSSSADAGEVSKH